MIFLARIDEQLMQSTCCLRVIRCDFVVAEGKIFAIDLDKLLIVCGSANQLNVVKKTWGLFI